MIQYLKINAKMIPGKGIPLCCQSKAWHADVTAHIDPAIILPAVQFLSYTTQSLLGLEVLYEGIQLPN